MMRKIFFSYVRSSMIMIPALCYLQANSSYSNSLYTHLDQVDEVVKSSSFEDIKKRKDTYKSSAMRAKLDISCKNPACSDTINILKKSLQKFDEPPTKKISSKSDIASIKTSKNEIPTQYVGCPVDKSLLGNSSWNLLHTICINYPESPTDKEKSMMINFMESFAHLYPCPYCAKDFQECIKRSPPRIESRKDLCIWMCERHNEVNHKLGKPLFPCTIDRIEERWLIGHVNCWNNITNTDDFSSQTEEDDFEQQTKDDLALSIIASSSMEEISNKNNNEDHSSIHVK